MVADFEAIISGLRNVKNRAIWRRTVGRVRLEAASESELRMETSHVVLSVCSSLSGLGSLSLSPGSFSLAAWRETDSTVAPDPGERGGGGPDGGTPGQGQDGGQAGRGRRGHSRGANTLATFSGFFRAFLFAFSSFLLLSLLFSSSPPGREKAAGKRRTQKEGTNTIHTQKHI